MNKNEIYDVLIEDIGNDGEGIGHFEDKNGSGNIAVFVKDAAVGDFVKVKLIKCKKKYAFGKLMEIITPAPCRVNPACERSKSCGGCAIMHMSYEKQLEYKFNKVKNCLERIGGVADVEKIMEPIYGMKNPYHFRNKMQFPVGVDKDGKVKLGFYAGRTHSIIDLDDCAIAHPINDYLVKVLKPWLQKWQDKTKSFIYSEETNKGLVRHILTRVGFTTGELMVCMVINGKKYPNETCVEELKEAINQAVTEYNNEKDFEAVEIKFESLCYNINTENTNKILGNKGGVTYGRGYICDYIGDVKFNISPMSFYQVNPEQTKVLYDKAVEYADLTGNEVVWDLYCGIGTISLFLAKKSKKVYGVEIVPQAIEDAKENASINDINNATFFCGKAEEVKLNEAADVVVVDPPRKGCDSNLLDTIDNINPRRLVYVSCDPATLARDVAYLREKGFGLDKVSVVDQFGHSTHVETVCLLSKLHEAKHHVSVKLDMDEMDITSAESKATYEEIKKYVAEHNDGMKVSSLNIAQVKRKCGIELAENLRVATRRMDCSQDNSTTAASDLELVPSHNLPKSEDSKQPLCPKEKEDAIVEAVKAFQMI